MLLENKVAIVTGAASGIGKDIKPQRAPEWAPFSPTETDCMAGHVRLELRNPSGAKVRPRGRLNFRGCSDSNWERPIELDH